MIILELFRNLNSYNKNELKNIFIQIIEIIQELADYLENNSKHKCAEKLFRVNLKFRKVNLLPNDPDIGTSMNNLAIVLHNLNRLK